MKILDWKVSLWICKFY